MNFINRYQQKIRAIQAADDTKQNVILKLAGTYLLTWIIFEVVAGFLYPIVMTWILVFFTKPKSIGGLSVIIEPRDIFLACGAFLLARFPDLFFTRLEEQTQAQSILAYLFAIVGTGAITAAIYARVDEITLRGYGMPVVSAWWFAILVALLSTLLISVSMALKAYENRDSIVPAPSTSARPPVV